MSTSERRMTDLIDLDLILLFQVRASEAREEALSAPAGSQRAVAAHGKHCAFKEAIEAIQARRAAISDDRLNRMADVYEEHLVASGEPFEPAPEGRGGQYGMRCECGWGVWSHNLMDCGWQHARHAALAIGQEVVA